MFVPRATAVVVIILGLANAAAGAPPVDVYVLSGQSNMYGLARLRDAHPENREPPPRCSMWDGEAFVALNPSSDDRPGEALFGPELSFCRTMSQLRPGRRHHLIKFAVPGRGLHHGWLKSKWLPGPPAPGRSNFYPGAHPTDPNVGRHYAELRDDIASALAALEASRIPFEVRGVLWMQGETDAIKRVTAEGYAVELAHLKKRLEEDVGRGALPFVYGQVLPRKPVNPLYLFVREIREAQARAHWNSGAPEAIQGAWMVATDGMPVGKQRLHYTAEGQILLGRAMALAMVQMQTVLADTSTMDDKRTSKPQAASR